MKTYTQKQMDRAVEEAIKKVVSQTYTQQEMDDATENAYDEGCENTSETYEYEGY